MIRDGVIHAGLARALAGLRHTEQFVICDSGLPLADVPTIDLGYRYGRASFIDVLEVVIPAVVVEDSWISSPMRAVNPTCHAALEALGLDPAPEDHELFKQRAIAAKFAVRTGEATMFANVVCQAGVPFGN